jgi:SAM-dependent methyltransferase
MTSKYSAEEQWTKEGAKKSMFYPSEYVIRIFKGNYPNLLMSKPQPGQSVLDVGCGDGRDLPFFASLGLDVFGVEISAGIIEQIRDRMVPFGIDAEHLQVGSCADIPYEDNRFDFVVAWNSVYYMSRDSVDFTRHADEILRVLKPGGWLVLSVPKSTAFIFEGSEPSGQDGCRIIRKDPFGLRVGEIMRVFDSGDELAGYFEKQCDVFCHASIHDDCFGLAYHWHLLVVRKKMDVA